MAKPRKGLGIEPHTMQVPTMDRPSIAFAWFLDSMRIEEEEGVELVMFCALCDTNVCGVEHGDTLRVLLNTALAHDCVSRNR